MTSRAGVRLLAIVALGCAGAAVFAQGSGVPSLSVRLAPKSVNVAVVSIENTSEYQLWYWYLEIVGDNDRVAQIPKLSKDALSLREIDDGDGHIRSHERRRLRLVMPDGFTPKSVRLTYLTICCPPIDPASSDRAGTVNEGDQSIFDEQARRADAISASTKYWQTALAQAPTDDAALRDFTEARLAESAKFGSDDAAFTRGSLLNALEDCAPNALRSAIRDRQSDVARMLEAPSDLRPRAGGPVTSATVTLERQETTHELVAYVSNQRGVPADVWEVEIYSLPESRWPFKAFTSHGGHDSRVTASSIDRPIGPHETRELPVTIADWREGVVPVPRAVTTVAVFDDGRFEGSAERRAQLLAERSRDALDIGYWLQPLRLVKNVSAADAVDALRDRLRTRKCQSTSTFHTDHFASTVSSAARQIESNPERKDAILDAAIARLEDERQAILKLVSR